MNEPAVFVMQIIVLLFSAVVHEVSHGLVALWRGDETAKMAGRLTLNPLPHIDPIMSIVLPVFLVLTRSPFVFAAAKPVPVNPLNLKDPEKDIPLVAAAGPASNIAMAAAAGLLFRVIFFALQWFNFPADSHANLIRTLAQLLQILVLINMMLAFVNLMPIPPLDGSKIVAFALRGKAREKYLSINGFIGIFLLMVFFVFLRRPFFIAIQFVSKLILGL
ncbi:site-2 protease family protein [candidate division WOR-3 bacterium]|nr:site-2 protease family protein [candidate division WOR-3 bacterium]